MERTAYRLADIVARFGGQVMGDADTRVQQIGTLEHATAGQIAFLANAKYRSQLEGSKASAVILSRADVDATGLPRIVCDNPYSYFARLSAFLNPLARYVPGVHPSAIIGKDVQISAQAYIGPLVTIGDGAVIGEGAVVMAGCCIGEGVTLGRNTRLYPRVTIYHGCLIGSDVIVHSGAVIGADGFGIAMDEGRWLKIPQIGRVVIGDHVEIGANTTIDRGALDDTVIEEGAKLDNQIQVAHNVRIGAHTAIAGCVGIAGSATIGKYCRIGGSAGILGHLQIADNVEVASFTLVGKSISEPGSYAGIYPFSKNDEWRNNAVHLRHLGDLVKRVKALEKEIATLKGEKV
ncbi:UDP-3-O-(3-hydroxymyristoyl)glucosamine N-acyltransferase [Sideroxydans lithotrophicus]|uniref:UDP-3-O-acylglucosamine N-acyltransferase n=1 Tax=Sideroxydans lithotrophicus (strain ES-1) TaxID=580332 RepID=D5CSD8_SIDLE|nr:UDP-3-O-(3-hydroxymyristoyl)glucosamine N-acyltransferase [Sideroxydans lithotrophicus]ADE11874.1 UDP-3-O-(3-hydroxymyristoyl) glucosamine N-acyltransferase [Sideroxydans lithotrophicus ES-1]